MCACIIPSALLTCIILGAYYHTRTFVSIGDKIIRFDSENAIFSYSPTNIDSWEHEYDNIPFEEAQSTHKIKSEHLENFRYMPNLKRISLTANSIDDISEIGRITQLEELYLGGGDMYEKPADYSPLEKLVNLKTFELLGAENFDGYRYFENMPELNNIVLTFADISSEDMRIICSAEKLEYLNLFKCTIENPEMLANCKNLRLLRINSANIDDIGFLAVMDSIEYLDLRNIPAEDFSAVGEMKSLKEIFFSDEQITEEFCNELKNKGIKVIGTSKFK